MKITKSLIRQPIKTLAGVMLIALSTTILCFSVGQALALKATEQRLNRQFSTIALPIATEDGEATILSLTEDVQAWLEETSADRPDLLKGITHHGFLSAYIPGLTPMNYTSARYMPDTPFSHDNGNWTFYYSQPEPHGMPYSCAMFVLTLDEISEPEEQTSAHFVDKIKNREDFTTDLEYNDWLINAEKEYATAGYSVKLTGTITDVIALQEGYRDPTGMTARLTFSARTLEELDLSSLVPGEQYIVYGMDYYDEDWALRGYLADERNFNPVQIDAFDLSKLRLLTAKELEVYQDRSEATRPVALYDGWIYLTQYNYERVNSISMTLALPIEKVLYEAIRENGDGKLLELRPYIDLTYTDAYGNTVTYTEEEYIQRYRIPTIARLEGSLEDFLASAEGTQWQKALDRTAINNQAFAVIGVEKLGYLMDFARGNTRIVAGRDFTAEELETGARVCILQESLAAANGLEIGDTITTNFYHTDMALPYQEGGSGTLAALNPSASFYFDTTEFEETAEYTIVGFFRGERTWPDVAKNEYAFSPNTIFVPKSSVQMEMEYSNSILFTTPVIHNGKLEEFRELVIRAGYEDHFVYYDQGYSEIAANFHNYGAQAEQVLTVGAAIYTVLLLLFLLLYPGTQRKAVRTMESLGAPYFRRLAHVLTSSMAIILPAAILGGILGTLLWDRVAQALQTSAQTAVPLEIQPWAMAAVAAGQLLLALVLSILISIPIAAHKKLSGRR